MYPVRVNPFVVNDLAEAYVWLLDAVLPPVLPLPLYATVYVIGEHDGLYLPLLVNDL